MIKNSEIIQSIPYDRKLEMIADGNCLAADGLPGGMPRVISASAEGVNAACGGIYPSFPFLANSWDSELISAVAGDLSLRAKEQGANLLFTPAGKTKSNPYTAGISEDPFYTATVLSCIVKAAKSVGITPCITGCALTDCDADYLDVFPDARAIHEYVFSPLKFFNGSYGNIFMTSFTRLSGNYEKINCEAVSSLLHSAAADGGFVICLKVESDLAAESVAAGNVFAYESDISALKAAAGSTKQARESGETAVLSAETIDEAADKIVDFALYCNIGAGGKNNGVNYDTQNLSLKAAEESIVLLKNDGILPLNGSEKLGVIGQPAFFSDGAALENFSALLEKNSVKTVGAAQGYTLSDGRCDSLLTEAVNLAEKCDTVLLFLGPDKQSEDGLPVSRSLKLPENRLALIGALKDVGVKIIAVLTTPESVDVSFDGGVSALLTAPVSCLRGGEALVNILKGKSPCGKLANTLYADTDRYFEKIKNDKNCGRIRVGLFSGYRYYSTAGIAVKYPFGHGLSYTTFSYSGLVVQGGQILVTVKNTGSRDGSETVQLYTGKPDSKVIRPLKEFKSYVKVYLRAGEAKTLRFCLTPEKLAVYCRETGKNVTEGGIYNFYVGSSVNDIKLSGRIQVYGSVLKPDNARLSDYIPTLSNVVEGGYTLAPVQKVAPDGRRLKFTGLIIMLIAALGAVIFAVLNLVRVMSFDTGGAVPFLTVIILLFAAAAVLLVIGFIQTRSAKTRPTEVCTDRPETVKVETDSLDSLFEQEFGETNEETVDSTETAEDGQEIQEYPDGCSDFISAAENLCTFCTERGLAVNINTARKILSAFAASRVILLKSSNQALCTELLKLLCGFFGSECTVEKYEKGGAEEFLSMGGGSVLNAIANAAEAKQYITPVCIENADIGDIGNILAPFEKYFKNPETGICLDADKKIKLSHNLWFVFVLSEKSYISDADIYASEIACVLDLELASAPVKENKTEIDTLSCYGLKKLSEAAKKTYTLDEEKGWKKVDKLEKFVCSHTPFAIDNKAWQSVEKFVSAYLASGGKEADALDNVIAAKLAIMACANLKGKLKPSDGSILSAVENIFGDGHISETKKILKHSGHTPARRSGNAGK